MSLRDESRIRGHSFVRHRVVVCTLLGFRKVLHPLDLEQSILQNEVDDKDRRVGVDSTVASDPRGVKLHMILC